MPRSKDIGYRGEVRFAELVDGKRTGGDQDGGEGDVQTDTAVYEIKTRRSLPQWLLHAFDQVEAAAARTGKENGGVALWLNQGRGKPRRLFVLREWEL